MEIREEIPSLEVLKEYATVPISFHGQSRFYSALHGDKWSITEEAVPEFYKDYDTLEHPTQWFEQFDMSRWIIFSAFESKERVGGFIIAIDTPGVDMLEGRNDLAVLWDIRISENYRRQSIGSTLFEKAVEWSIDRGCKEIKVETQDINVAACRFYSKMGCELRIVRPGAYAGLPDEVQFLWYRTL